MPGRNFAAPATALNPPLARPAAARPPLAIPLPAPLPRPGSFFSPRTINEPSAVSPPRRVVPNPVNRGPIAGMKPFIEARIPPNIPLSSSLDSLFSILSPTPSIALISF